MVLGFDVTMIPDSRERENWIPKTINHFYHFYHLLDQFLNYLLNMKPYTSLLGVLYSLEYHKNFECKNWSYHFHHVVVVVVV